MRTQSIDPVGDPRWRAFVESDEGASIFHHPAWLSLLRDQYGYELSACCVLDGDSVVAGLPLAAVRSRLTGNRLVALPFSDFCPPLDSAPGSAAQLAAGLGDAHAGSGLPIEVRAPMEELAGARLVGEHFRHVLAIPSPDEARRGTFARSAARRGATKARREGVEVERRTDAGAVEAFYHLHLETRRRQGVPIQPRSFIRRLTGLFDQGLGFVLVASLGPQPLAAAVFLSFNGTLTYKYGASDPRHLDKRPNNLLFMEAVGWAAEHGIATLDFGRTEADNEGLRSFKRLWGADELPLAYTHLGGEQAKADGAAMRAASTLIRRGPRWVGRLIGESLYRHFG